MKKNEIVVFFYQGYGGTPKCEATFGGKSYVIETSYIASLLRNMIGIMGCNVSKTNRQKYPRLTITGADKLYKLPKE